MSWWRMETAVSPCGGNSPDSAAQHDGAAIDGVAVEALALEDVGAADEARHEFRARALVDVLGRAGLLDDAPVHHDDQVGRRHGFGLVVRHVDGRVAVFVVQPADLETHLLAEVGVEVRERLVEEQDLGLDDERAGQRHALLLAAGQLARVAARERRELGDRQDALDPALHILARQVAQAQAVGDVLEHGHVRPERVALEDHRHVAALGRLGAVRARDRPPADPDGALVRLDEAGHQPQRRGLAAAGRAEKADEEAFVDRQRNVLHDRGVAVALGQTCKLDKGHRPSRRAPHGRTLVMGRT